jgi:putative ABC transport system permease protein
VGPNLPASQLIFYVSAGGQVAQIPQQSTAQLQGLQSRVTALAAELHARYLLALYAAVDPVPATTMPGYGTIPGGKQAVALGRAIPSCTAPGVEGAGQVYVATPALLRHYGIKPAGISPGTDLLTSRTDLAGAELSTAEGPVGCGYDSGNRFVSHLVIQNVSLPAYTSDPNTLLTTHAMRAFGWRPMLAGWLFAGREPATIARQPIE